MEDPAIAIDAARLEQAMAAVAEAENRVDGLYLRWTELEAKLK
jgi:ATP-binding cassette subfamily F protein uup